MHFVDNKKFEAAFLKFVRDLAFCIDKGRVSKTVELLNKGDSRKSFVRGIDVLNACACLRLYG